MVLAVALPVMAFGFLQYTILPDDILGHFGYSRENGVLSSFHIDNKPDLERVTSTLREPNVYGAYLLIIISIVSALILKSRNRQVRNTAIGLLGLTVLNLYFTFSRSAWVGGAVSVLFFGYWSILRGLDKKIILRVLVVGSVIASLCLASLFVARNTYFVKNVIFHADESTVLEDPNELRLRFFRESIELTIANPIGYGPGTAGLVSIRNDEQGVVLNENYYLQIAHEVGVLGLVLFIAILALAFIRLISRLEKGWFYIALTMSLIGLSFTNLLVHIWPSEAVTYTWWGLAGLGYFYVIPQKFRPKKSQKT